LVGILDVCEQQLLFIDLSGRGGAALAMLKETIDMEYFLDQIGAFDVGDFVATKVCNEDFSH